MDELIPICLTVLVLAVLYRNREHVEFRALFIRFTAKSATRKKPSRQQRSRKKKEQ